MSSTNIPSPKAGSSKVVAKKILAGRKCYRVSKTSNEVVWPPLLEEALIEGLEKYEPAVSKSPRGLSRFPNRNKFIAQYILQKTGQIRTAKQVGSRIQQLRDTAAGKHSESRSGLLHPVHQTPLGVVFFFPPWLRLCCHLSARLVENGGLTRLLSLLVMKAYSDKHYEMMHPTRRSPSEQGDGLGLGVPAVTLSANGASVHMSSIPPVAQVYISVPSAPSTSSNAAAWPASTSQPSLSRYTNVHTPHTGLYEFVEPRSLHSIDPTVTFASSSPANLYSRCNVFLGNNIVHVDPPIKMAVRASDESTVGGYLHYTKLAPGYWDALCAYLSPFTIVQEITKEVTDPAQKTATVLRVQYQFIQASSGQPRPLSPFMVNAEFDYDADSGSDIFPFFPSEALSIGSESPQTSDRSSSPSYTIPPGFISQPISPSGWTGQSQVPWQESYGATTVPANQLQQFSTPGFYGLQQQQTASVHQQQHTQQCHPQAPSGQYYGSSSF
ncbi:hypothetical protein PYCCODRAFT_1004357 [Trametes coccinea BRFM310]|uniref:TEA domain-containing protein n=1 Tax=Trametes coccinea (strain BRFM310) TaxID=1353009 RepID=A0A1Y2IB06_TRAC3|nr:hypothetical protein PYCCODRAFT_1004357 [Trametes coccinea BRFM310]